MRARSPARWVGALLLAAAVVAVGGPAGATDDTNWDKQWAPALIGAPAAWATSTGAGVIIGIVDTGVDLNHEDLAGKVVAHTTCNDTAGDAARCAGSGQDPDGHGTHVAGIAAATKDNGRGIAGIAPDARLAVARVFKGDTAKLTDVEAGIRWVVDRGAKVVNLSLEASSFLGLFGGGGEELVRAVDYAWSKGAVPVLASGNASLFSGSANYGGANAVVVGATGRSDELASYSTATGSAKWAILAPGGNSARGGQTSEIYSTWLPNSYAYVQGTSMATPHVAGALALLLARGLSQQQAVDTLLATANRSVSCGGGSPNCVGRLDVARAVASTGPPVTAPPATAAPATTPPTTAPSTTAPSTTAAPTAPTAAPAGPASTPANDDPARPGSGDAAGSPAGGAVNPTSSTTGAGRSSTTTAGGPMATTGVSTGPDATGSGPAGADPSSAPQVLSAGDGVAGDASALGVGGAGADGEGADGWFRATAAAAAALLALVAAASVLSGGRRAGARDAPPAPAPG